MKSFKEFLAEKEAEKRMWYTFESEGYVVHIWFDSEELHEINEAKYKGTPIGGQYSAQLHQAHSTVGQQHLHVYAKNNQLFSLNKDGSAHDRSHTAVIPNKVAKAIKNHFPSFELSSKNIIEYAPQAVQLLFKLEIINEAM
jgi:hypothetical protein